MHVHFLQKLYALNTIDLKMSILLTRRVTVIATKKTTAVLLCRSFTMIGWEMAQLLQQANKNNNVKQTNQFLG